MMAKRSKNPFVRTYQSIKDIYANRVILLALVRRNTAGRYKSTYIGFGWHLLMPVLMIIVLHIVFDSIRAGVLLTMFDGRLNLTQQVVSEIKKFFPNKVYKTTIPRNVRLSEAPSFGEPIMYYDKNSKGAIAYNEFAEEFLSQQK